MTNNSMILKMAIAMSNADFNWGRETADPWDRKSKHQRQRYLRMAMAVLSVMREPTEAMIKNVPPRPIWQDEARDWYRYMIDAELAKGRSPLVDSM